MTYSLYANARQTNSLVTRRNQNTTFSRAARLEVGFLLRRLQQDEILGLPQVRPLPVIAPHCYELRIRDENKIWRIVYLNDTDALVILTVFEKKTRRTPPQVLETCRHRLQMYQGKERTH